MGETETRTPAPVFNKTSFKNKNVKKPKSGAKGGTLTSQLLDAAASTVATATPAERAEKLALAKARRDKKRSKNKAASAATPKKKMEKKKKKEKEAVEEEAAAAVPAIPLS